MIVFGRRISAADALQNGLVSRVLWPENFNEQVLTIVKDIATQPAQVSLILFITLFISVSLAVCLPSSPFIKQLRKLCVRYAPIMNTNVMLGA